MRKTTHTPLLISLCLSLLIFCPIKAQAADLMDIFRGVLNHDPTWDAAKMKLEADKQRGIISESALFPKLVSYADFKTIETSGSGNAIINPIYLDQNQLLQCFQEAGSGQECSPPLTIRDDLGGSYDTYRAGLELRQPIYNYRMWRQYNKSKINDDEASSSFENAQQDLILAIAKLYFAVLEAHEQWQLSKTETELAKKLLDQTVKLFQLGLVPQNDVYDTRTALDSKQLDLLRAATTLENTQETLMFRTQRRDVALATLSESLLVEAPQPRNVEEWVKRGLKQNRSLLAAHSKTLATEQDIAITRAGFHPEIDFIAGYGISKNDKVAFESSPSVSASGIGIEIRYPIYLGGLTSAQVTGAKLLHQSATKEFEAERRDVIRKVRNTYRKVNNDVKAVEAAELAIHSSKKSLDAAEAGYNAGIVPLAIVIKAQSDWFKAKKAHASARYLYITDSLELKYEAGTLAIADLRIINSWLDVDKLILPPSDESGEGVDVDFY